MSKENINDNPDLIKIWMNNEATAVEKYRRENPNSLITCFEEEIKELGFSFEVGSQIISFMPKHKNKILPIAIKYYQLAKAEKKNNEQDYFMSYFHFKGFNEVVPILLADFNYKETSDLTRWFIADCIYQIQAKDFIQEYLDIVKNKKYGQNRQMIILLLGKIREERAVPILIDLLEDEEVRLHAICALGEFKREGFRCYFERFQDAKHSGWRKYAKAALKKLEKQKI